MKVGMNLLLWTGAAGKEHYPIFKQLKAWGFDGVEIPMFSTDGSDWAELAVAVRMSTTTAVAALRIRSAPRGDFRGPQGKRWRILALPSRDVKAGFDPENWAIWRLNDGCQPDGADANRVNLGNGADARRRAQARRTAVGGGPLAQAD